MNIGLVAHDSKKKLMQNFCIAYRGILNRNELYATETTGRLVGGGQQLCSMIEMNQIDMIIFLRDPDNCSHEDEREASNMFRVCDMHNIPFATNLATAELMIKALERGDLDWREMYK